MAGGKKTKKVTRPELLLPLGKNERHIRVVFHAQLIQDEKGEFETSFVMLQNSDILISAKLGDETENLTLYEVIANKIASSPLGAQGKKDASSGMKAVANESGELSCTLAEKRITVTLDLLRHLCSGFSDENVSFFLPAKIPSNTEEVSSTVVAKTGGKRDEGVIKAGGREKRRGSTASRFINATCIETIKFRFEGITQSTSMRYELNFREPISGIASCWVDLVCGDEPLLNETLMSSYRPVSIVINALDLAQNLLSDESVESDTQSSQSTPSKPPAASETESESRPTSQMTETNPLLDTASTEVKAGNTAYIIIECLGHTITTPCLPIHRHREGDDPSTSKKEEPFRTVIFLGDASPLRVFQCMLLEWATVSVYKKVPLHRLAADGISSKFHFGSASFSLRGLIERQQTHFFEEVQLLPNRTSLVTTESVLTSGGTVSLSIDFFHPFPQPIHVQETGEPVLLEARNFMTRGVIIMPYEAEWVEAAISTFLHELLQLKRAGPEANVQLFKTPTKEDKKEDDLGNAPLPTHGGKSAPGPRSQSRNSRRVSSARTDSGNREKKRGKNVATPPPSPLPPSKTAFEEPFRIISPEGISGFEVIDREIRLICVEGPHPEVHRLLQTTAESCHHPPEMKILYNSELFFPLRFYSEFPPLVTTPDLAMRQVSEEVKPGIITPASSFKVDDLDSSKRMSVDAPAVEAEGGGTGGRMHRISLREPLRVMVKQQRYLLHRLLSDECLHCLQKLFSLSQCSSLYEASQRQYFPSAAELIHLERSFGQTLDLQDIFARKSFVNLCDILAPESSKSTCRSEKQKNSSRMHEVDVTNLQEEDVGCLTSFQGMLSEKYRRVPHEVTRRYATSLWMTSHASKAPVLCAFPREVPGGTIQYALEGQVVRAGNTLLLYVMEFHTMSNNVTISKNPAYETFLRRRRWFEKQVALHSGRTKSIRPPGTQHNSFSLGESKYTEFSMSHEADSRCTGTDTSESDDDFLPPLADVVSIGSSEEKFKQYWENRFSKPRGTRTSNLLEKVNRKERPTAEYYEQLWEMYDKRAKVEPPPIPQGPVMHFGPYIPEKR